MAKLQSNMARKVKSLSIHFQLKFSLPTNHLVVNLLSHLSNKRLSKDVLEGNKIQLIIRKMLLILEPSVPIKKLSF